MIINPSFYEREGGAERAYDLFSRLLRDRIVLLFNEVNDDLACTIIGQLLYLEALDATKDISIYINSPGGSVHSGLAIYDTIRHLKCDVSTIGVGMCASMGAFILSSGTKGKRFALPSCEIMIHQVLGGAQGQATDIEIETKHMLGIKQRLNTLLAENTGKTFEEVTNDTERNHWMTAEEAMQYGIIDKVIL